MDPWQSLHPASRSYGESELRMPHSFFACYETYLIRQPCHGFPRTIETPSLDDEEKSYGQIARRLSVRGWNSSGLACRSRGLFPIGILRIFVASGQYNTSYRHSGASPASFLLTPPPMQVSWSSPQNWDSTGVISRKLKPRLASTKLRINSFKRFTRHYVLLTLFSEDDGNI